MKKVIFISALAIAAAASCTKSDIVDTKFNDAIGFENYLGRDAQTKASVITGDAITTVKVNAYLHKKETTGGANFISNFMTNQDVDKATGTYSPAKYWPAIDQAVDFVAWVPATNATVENATLTFTVPDNVTEQEDLLVANPVLDQNRAEENTKVNLQFKHLLSRIGFEIQATGLPGENDEYNVVELVSVTLNGDFAPSGTVDMTAETPAVVGTPKETAYVLTGDNFGFSNNVIENKANSADSYIMLIPSNNVPKNITVVYTVTTKAQNDDEEDVVITNKSVFPLQTEGAEPFAYKPGFAYKYIFKITMSAIQFDVEEKEWDETTPVVDITPEDETPEA